MDSKNSKVYKGSFVLKLDLVKIALKNTHHNTFFIDIYCYSSTPFHVYSYTTASYIFSHNLAFLLLKFEISDRDHLVPLTLVSKHLLFLHLYSSIIFENQINIILLVWYICYPWTWIGPTKNLDKNSNKIKIR